MPRGAGQDRPLSGGHGLLFPGLIGEVVVHVMDHMSDYLCHELMLSGDTHRVWLSDLKRDLDYAAAACTAREWIDGSVGPTRSSAARHLPGPTWRPAGSSATVTEGVGTPLTVTPATTAASA